MPVILGHHSFIKYLERIFLKELGVYIKICLNYNTLNKHIFKVTVGLMKENHRD